MNIFKKTDSHEFKPLLVEIDEEPQNPLGRLIFWTIMAALLFFALWMYLGKVDVVVTARGKVIPRGEVKVVQPLTTGVIRRIMVAEGDYIRQGQVLMEIDPSQTEPELASMRATLMQVSLESQRLQANLNQQEFRPPGDYDPALLAVQMQIYQSTREHLADQLQVKTEQLHQLAEKLTSLQKDLAQKNYLVGMFQERLQRVNAVRDIVSQQEYSQAESDYKGAVNDRVMAQHQVAETRAARQQVVEEMTFIREDERNKLLAELADKRREQLALRANVEKFSFLTGSQQIVAPVAGHVGKLFINTVGGVVTPAEKLLTLVPSDSPLLIKALVESKDSGFVAAGMAASIKVDTFNFQKYGILPGRVLQVAHDSLEDEHLGLVYEAYIKPDKTTLLVEGKETPVTIGMGVTVEVKTGKRRIIEFFIYPLIKYLDEGISVR